jgi:sugar phosphate isomerase/epimerase
MAETETSMTASRREVLKLLASAAALPSLTHLTAAEAQPKLAFSTLGCPKWTWRQILDTAVREGYAGVELRGLEGEMDLTKRAEFSASGLAQVLTDLKSRNLKISDLGSSVQLHHADAATRAKHLDDGRRFIDLAQKLQAPYVRVFGDKLVEGEQKSVTVARIAQGMRELAAHAKGSGVAVVIESHGDFTDSPTLLDLLQQSGDGTGLLWDTHHTVVAGKETPAETFARLGRFVKHTHIKDSVPAGTDRKYVLTGTGEVPIREIVRTLVAGGYTGYYCFEWEKVWHPDIDEPEVAIPHYAKTMREYLGVKVS